MRRIIFTVILALLNIISFSQNVSNVSVKQVDGNIQLIFDLNKSVSSIEVLYSQFGDEYEVLKKINGGLTTQAGKSKQITLTPDFFFCNLCSFRIRAYDNLLVDNRDGKIYSIIDINNKTWIAENLNYIPQNGSSVCPGLLDEGCKIFGRLYDYQTAKSVCPNGWRLPKEADWDELIEFAGGKDIAVKMLKSSPPLWSGASSTDVLFNALPSGFAKKIEQTNQWFSSSFGSSAYWWTSLGENISKGLCFYLFDTFLGSSLNYTEDFYLSVRCLKDNYK